MYGSFSEYDSMLLGEVIVMSETFLRSNEYVIVSSLKYVFLSTSWE